MRLPEDLGIIKVRHTQAFQNHVNVCTQPWALTGEELTHPTQPSVALI